MNELTATRPFFARDEDTSLEADTVRADLLRDLMVRLGERWSFCILVELSKGPCRFNALSRVLDGISRRTLSATLKHLERDGFVARETKPDSLKHVEYRLTPQGFSVLAPIEKFEEWIAHHKSGILSARLRFHSSAE